MVNFEDDFFAPMVQDESRKKLSSGTSGSNRGSVSGRGGSGSSTRASLNGTSTHSHRPSSSSSSSNKPSSSSSSSRPSGSSSKSSSQHSSRGSDHGSSRGTEEVAKRGDPTQQQHRPSTSSSSRRSGSRDNPSSQSLTPAEPDYDYGEPQQDQGLDYGYGDPEGAPQASSRSRRQRRCSIADVLNVPGESTDDESVTPSLNGPPGSGVDKTSSSSSLPRNKAMERNIAIPMAATEERKQGRARRASLMGAMGAMGFGGDDKKEAEAASKESKKPGQDRDRRRQGTLMDRVGAGDRDRSNRNGGPSYSDRILSK